MNDQQIADTIKSIYDKKQQILAINAERIAEEKAITEQYLVDECNAKRNALAVKYTNLAKPIYDEIDALQKSIEESLA